MSEIDAILAGLGLDRAVGLAIVGVPALVLGYCAGRLQGTSPPAAGAIDAYDPADDDAGDADLALARDSDGPRLVVPEPRTLAPGPDRASNGDRAAEHG